MFRNFESVLCVGVLVLAALSLHGCGGETECPGPCGEYAAGVDAKSPTVCFDDSDITGGESLCKPVPADGCLEEETKCAQDVQSKDDTPGVVQNEDAKPPDAPSNNECARGFERFANIADQVLAENEVGKDPYFPPAESSIAAPGTTCGDSAAGYNYNCADLSNWGTFQSVASVVGKDFKVIGSSITFDDVGQGLLGNCYLLSGIASLAMTHPSYIEDMFVERELWEKNIFKTKWLLNGGESVIAVDNTVPTSPATGELTNFMPSGRPLFTQPSATGEFWPVIIAKAWAKIFGSYKASEAGDAAEVIKAMTRAPSMRYLMLPVETVEGIKQESGLTSITGIVAKDATIIFQRLTEYTTKNYPMSAGTSEAHYGLASGHSYAVLKAYTHSEHGQVVQIYNPWASQNYKGAIPRIDDKPGAFTMSISEFVQAFSDLSINYVKAGMTVSSQTIPAGKIFDGAVSVSASGEFFVELTWPNARMVAPCDGLTPNGFLKAESPTSPGSSVGTIVNNYPPQLQSIFYANSITLQISEGGTYNIKGKEIFRESASWLDELTLVVYSSGPATITLDV
jgi:hypothetical protein